VSRDPGRIPETLDEWDYEFVVTDSSGKEARRTDYGRQMAERDRGGRRIDRTIEPGGEIRKTFNLDRFYTFNEPGRYYVRAARTVVPANGTAAEKAVSNIATFVVAPE
jgi:hypothetical protein